MQDPREKHEGFGLGCKDTVSGKLLASRSWNVDGHLGSFRACVGSTVSGEGTESKDGEGGSETRPQGAQREGRNAHLKVSSVSSFLVVFHSTWSESRGARSFGRGTVDGDST